MDWIESLTSIRSSSVRELTDTSECHHQLGGCGPVGTSWLLSLDTLYIIPFLFVLVVSH